jgi:decaprenylphospho-beta-D-erythro-pentofuranosid-2-ulose 2-reductase
MRNALGDIQSLLVLGGSSEIGLATAETFARNGCRTVVLAGRDLERLETAAARVRAAGAATASTIAFDADHTDAHPQVIERIFDEHGDIDCVLVAFGVLGDADTAPFDHEQAMQLMQTNAMGAISAVVPVVERMQRQGHGAIIVLSSAGAERVRASNAVYGAAKAALDGYAQGLGDALRGSGIHVMVVRPGFVHTRMTAGLEVPPLSTTPQGVADAIVDGLRRGAETVWVPKPMRAVMSVLRHLPRPIFRRLDL